MAKMGELIQEMLNLPSELNTPKNVLLLDPSMRNHVFTHRRLEIIRFLKDQNPVTVDNLKQLYGEEAFEDILVLQQLNLITLEDMTPYDKSIVRLNRDLTIIPQC